MKARPETVVLQWIAHRDRGKFYTTSVTQAEILHGVRSLPLGRRRKAIETAADAMFREDFAERILPFDSEAAYAYVELVTDRRRFGRPITQFDAQIAAIVRVAGATLATRNVKDFERCGMPIVNPWNDG
jgi:predicted nucleic acid-binding protein